MPPKAKPSVEERQLVVTLFSVAHRFNALARAKSAPERKRLQFASRAIFGTAQALATRSDTTLVEIARASATLVRRHRVADRFAVSATEREAELVAFCVASQNRLNKQLAAGAPDDESLEDWAEGMAMHLQVSTWPRPDDRREIVEKLARIGIVEVCQNTPTRLARRVLRALGVTPAALKNFGAGVAKRRRVS